MKKAGNFTFRYIVMSVIKVTSKEHLEVKLVTVIEYAVKDGIKKNDSTKSCKSHEGLFFGDLDFKLDFQIDLGTDLAS